MYLQACIHFACFASQLCSALQQLDPLAVQGRCQWPLVLEGSLTEAGQALIGCMEVRQCVYLSNFILQVISTFPSEFWSFTTPPPTPLTPPGYYLS